MDIYFFQLRLLEANGTIATPQQLLVPSGAALSAADFFADIIAGSPGFIIGVLDMNIGDQPIDQTAGQ